MNKFGFEEIKKFVRLVEKSEISELEIVQEGVTLRIRKEAAATIIQQSIPQNTAIPSNPITSDITTEGTESTTTPVKSAESSDSLYQQKSPMVGTFYRAPSPGAEPYVRTGDIVEAGKILCIVEAMKLMNEIEAEISGKIIKICVDNSKPVEYGQVLFEIDPNG